MRAKIAPILNLSNTDQKLKNFELEEGLILIIISINNIIIGTIINSFLPSVMNLVRKFANKKYPVKTEIRPIDLDLQVSLRKPKNKLFNLLVNLENLVFCITNSH